MTQTEFRQANKRLGRFNFLIAIVAATVVVLSFFGNFINISIRANVDEYFVRELFSMFGDSTEPCYCCETAPDEFIIDDHIVFVTLNALGERITLDVPISNMSLIRSIGRNPEVAIFNDIAVAVENQLEYFISDFVVAILAAATDEDSIYYIADFFGIDTNIAAVTAAVIASAMVERVVDFFDSNNVIEGITNLLLELTDGFSVWIVVGLLVIQLGTILVWALLFLFAFIRMFARNKRVYLANAQGVGWIAFSLFAIAPMIGLLILRNLSAVTLPAIFASIRFNFLAMPMASMIGAVVLLLFNIIGYGRTKRRVKFATIHS